MQEWFQVTTISTSASEKFIDHMIVHGDELLEKRECLKIITERSWLWLKQKNSICTVFHPLAKFHCLVVHYFLWVERRVLYMLSITERHTPVATHCLLCYFTKPGQKLLLQLKEHDEYTFLHSINVGVLALDFGFYLNLDMTFLQNLFLAGILHDIGKLDIPSELLNKKEPLTDTEFCTDPLSSRRWLHDCEKSSF